MANKIKNPTFTVNNSSDALIAFTHTSTPNQAMTEIGKFMCAANWLITPVQMKMFRALIKHYGNLVASRSNKELQKKGDEIYRLYRKYEPEKLTK